MTENGICYFTGTHFVKVRRKDSKNIAKNQVPKKATFDTTIGNLLHKSDIFRFGLVKSEVCWQ
jgi:hypothetical protein